MADDYVTMEERLREAQRKNVELQAEISSTLAVAEKAISFGTVKFEQQTVPLFHMAVKNEIFRALRTKIRKNGPIKQEDTQIVASTIARYFFNTLGRFGIQVDDSKGAANDDQR
jgi:hypothetical protein